MKNISLLILMLILCTALLADISQYYTFSPGTGTYTTITGTDVPTAVGDDVISTPIDIGFSFTYGLNSYTQVQVSSNGYVTLGTTPGSTLSNQLTSTSYCPVIAPLWDDTGYGTVQYLLTGTAPTRVFTVQYTAVKWYYGSTTAFNYQVKLFESGRVEMCYDTTASTPSSPSASIGINMLPGGASNFWSVTPGNPATASNTVENSTISTWPGANVIYAFVPPVPVPNDMAALSISGNLTPSMGIVSNYTIAVKNNGTASQSTYSVKLMSGTTELATVAGPTLAPGITQNVVIPWTPTAAGAMAIFGRVVLAGDQNPQNDNTTPINVVVQAQGTTVVTVGSGTNNTQLYVPDYPFYTYTYSQQIYLQSEINTTGMRISDIAWYCNGNTVDWNEPNVDIYIGHTTATAFATTSDWLPISNMTPVYSGPFTLPLTPGWVNFHLTLPFVYNNTDNLVVAFNENGGPASTYTSSATTWMSTTTTGNRSIYVYQDTAPYVATAIPPTPTGTGIGVNAAIPNARLTFEPVPTIPVFYINPTSKDFGTVLMNSTNTQPFMIQNTGSGSLGLNSITLTGSPMFTLTNVPSPLPSLASTQSMTFNVVYHPTAAGTHTGTITIVDNLTRTSHTVQLTAVCIDPTIYTSPYSQAFDAVTVPNLPIDWQKLTTGIGTVTTVTTTPHSGANCVYMYNSSDTSGPFLIAPILATTLPTNTMRIHFWAKGATTYTVSVGVMSDPTSAASFTQIQNITLTAAWAEYVVGFQTYTGTGRYITIKHGNSATYQSIYIDDVTIEVIAANDLAALSVSGNTTPSVGMVSNYTVNIFNWGTVAQTAYTVKLMSGTTELGSIAGPTIQPGMTATATLPWSPTTQGPAALFGRIILTGDQNAVNNDSPPLNVSVQAAGTMVVTIGAGDQTARMPLDFFYKNSLNETIYLQTELNFIGMITGISLYNNFADDRQNMPTKVWLGTTTQTDLSTGWIPSTQLTSVFDGNISYPIGQNTVNITFPTPFLYLTGNLVVMFNRPMDTVYYSSVDYFQCQTVGTNRALNVWNDVTLFDPAAPPAGTVATGQFAKTSFFIIPGGVGHLNGTVTGAGGVPLEGALVQIVNGAQTTTNAVGHYAIQNIVAGDYQVTVTRNGYISQTQNVTIPEDQTITLNFNMVQMTTVVLSGTIVGSDAPTVGLSGATISFTGYEDYEATTDATGHFSIPGVYANQTYDYFASIAGYQGLAGTVNVLNANLDMGNVILSEIAFSPRNVTATANEAQTIATVTWQAPDPNTADVSAGFEGTAFPPAEWSRIITDNGPPNASGVLPTWCRIGAVTVGADVITPPEGSWQAGFSYSFSHQDEWLITPQFNCPQGAVLTFESNVFLGSVNGDHYYVKATTDNGVTWTVLWDATALTGGWNHYATPINVDLAQFTGQQIKVAWHGDDPNTSSDGMWYVWFVDNVSVGNATQTIRFPESQMVTKSAAMTYTRTTDLPAMSASKAGDSISRTLTPAVANMSATHQNRDADRSLVGYKVWRLPQGQEQNESVWTLLTPTVITALTLDDTGWATLTEGTYKWAVKGIYTNNVASLAIFSNPVVRPLVQMGTLAGTVRNQQNQPIMGATITVGNLTATTAANGSYVLPIPAGSYSVTCTATNYIEQVQNNIVITGGQTTPVNFILAPVDNDDHVVIDMTALKGNYPNPFNPQTTIAYDVKNSSPVRLDIYNTKGQLIRTLVNEVKATGHYSVVWNGKDSKGNAVASGVYNYRMQSGDYKSTRRMMLMK